MAYRYVPYKFFKSIIVSYHDTIEEYCLVAAKHSNAGCQAPRPVSKDLRLSGSNVIRLSDFVPYHRASVFFIFLLKCSPNIRIRRCGDDRTLGSCVKTPVRPGVGLQMASKE